MTDEKKRKKLYEGSSKDELVRVMSIEIAAVQDYLRFYANPDPDIYPRPRPTHEAELRFNLLSHWFKVSK